MVPEMFRCKLAYRFEDNNIFGNIVWTIVCFKILRPQQDHGRPVVIVLDVEFSDRFTWQIDVVSEIMGKSKAMDRDNATTTT